LAVNAAGAALAAFVSEVLVALLVRVRPARPLAGSALLLVLGVVFVVAVGVAAFPFAGAVVAQAPVQLRGRGDTRMD
jgi:predicted PurR-regulated permease PerM